MPYGGLGRLRCRLSPAFGFPWPRDQKSVPNNTANNDHERVGVSEAECPSPSMKSAWPTMRSTEGRPGFANPRRWMVFPLSMFKRQVTAPEADRALLLCGALVGLAIAAVPPYGKRTVILGISAAGNVFHARRLSRRIEAARLAAIGTDVRQ